VVTVFSNISFTRYLFFYLCIYSVAGTTLSSEVAVKQNSKSGFRGTINYYYN